MNLSMTSDHWTAHWINAVITPKEPKCEGGATEVMEILEKLLQLQRATNVCAGHRHQSIVTFPAANVYAICL